MSNVSTDATKFQWIPCSLHKAFLIVSIDDDRMIEPTKSGSEYYHTVKSAQR